MFVEEQKNHIIGGMKFRMNGEGITECIGSPLTCLTSSLGTSNIHAPLQELAIPFMYSISPVSYDTFNIQNHQQNPRQNQNHQQQGGNRIENLTIPDALFDALFGKVATIQSRPTKNKNKNITKTKRSYKRTPVVKA